MKLDIPTRRKRLVACLLHYAGYAAYLFAGLFRRPPRLPDPRTVAFERILVLRPDHLGDVLMMTPVLRALKTKYPRAHLAVLVGSWAEDLVRYNPHVDERIVYDCPWWAGIRGPQSQGGRFARLQRFLDGYRPLLARLREGRYDLVLDPRGDFRHLLLLMWLPGIPYRIGYGRTGGDYLLTHVVPFDPQLHNVQKNLEVLSPLGISGADPTTEVHAGSDADEKIGEILAEAGVGPGERIAVVHPGARTPIKKWPADRFALAADHLARRHGMRIVLVGGSEERELAARVRAAMLEPAIELAGRLSLLELVALFERCDLALSNDSGPMHLAASTPARMVAVFGPTDPSIYGYRAPGRAIVHHRLDCCPCHFEDACPLTPEPVSKCLDEVSADEVVARIDQVLAPRVRS